jgi:hypothetical protein
MPSCTLTSISQFSHNELSLTSIERVENDREKLKTTTELHGILGILDTLSQYKADQEKLEPLITKEIQKLGGGQGKISLSTQLESRTCS